MKKWNSFYEYVKFPITIVFLAYIAKSIGSFILSVNLAKLYTFDYKLIYDISIITVNLANVLIFFWPIITAAYILSKKYSATVPGILSLVSYFLIVIVMSYVMIGTDAFTNGYINIFNNATISLFGSSVLVSFVVYLVVNHAYKRSLNRSNYTLFNFMHRNSWALMFTLFLSSLASIVLVYLWPIFMNSINYVFSFISQDITNPVSLFFYGILDRLFSLFNSRELIVDNFLYGISGGSWISAAGETFTGDIPIWTAQSAANIFNTGAGRFITPYYLLQIFAIPGVLIAFSVKTNNKIEKRKVITLTVLATIISLFGNTLLPLELLMIVAFPTLYLAHLLISGVLFGLLQAMGVFIGFTSTFRGYNSVGNILDLLINYTNSNLTSSINTMLVLGVFVLVIYFVITMIFIDHFTLDPLKTGRKKIVITDLVELLGGIDNITHCSATPFKVVVTLRESNLVDFHFLNRVDVYKVTEGKNHYNLFMGIRGFVVCKEINKLKDRY